MHHLNISTAYAPSGHHTLPLTCIHLQQCLALKWLIPKKRLYKPDLWFPPLISKSGFLSCHLQDSSAQAKLLCSKASGLGNLFVGWEAGLLLTDGEASPLACRSWVGAGTGGSREDRTVFFAYFNFSTLAPMPQELEDERLCWLSFSEQTRTKEDMPYKGSTSEYETSPVKKPVTEKA